MGRDLSPGLSVRVLALGSVGEPALRALERALSSAWAPRWKLQVARETAGDDAGVARTILARWCLREGADVVLTVGRAGHLPQDFAPEVTASLLERPLPGIEERMCLAPPCRPSDLLHRGRAGFTGRTLIVNLPGRPARDAAIVRMLAPIIGHALGKARGDGGECTRPGGRR